MKKRFTLIEVLIVIAIIAIVSSIIIGAVKDSDQTPEQKATTQKQKCTRKVDAGYSLKDLPVYCLQYVKQPVIN